MIKNNFLFLKLKKLQKIFSKFDIKEYNHISKKVVDWQSKLDEAQILYDQNPMDMALRKVELETRKHTACLEAAERSFFVQKAKSSKLNMVDKSTKYFHSIARSKKCSQCYTFRYQGEW